MLKQVVALSMCLLSAACTAGDTSAEPVPPAKHAAAPLAPEFTGIQQWINSEPLTLSQLRGSVVLVEFWTRDCINCIHVMPHIKEWHERYKDQGLTVIGVHTPEYEHEKVPANVQATVKRFGLEYPIALDNDYATWNAYGNRFWPALYLIDAQGRVVYRHYGEGSYAETEAQIKRSLATR
jgi:thiol-disulfide isomerase/thioredoxin